MDLFKDNWLDEITQVENVDKKMKETRTKPWECQY